MLHLTQYILIGNLWHFIESLSHIDNFPTLLLSAYGNEVAIESKYVIFNTTTYVEQWRGIYFWPIWGAMLAMCHPCTFN